MRTFIRADKTYSQVHPDYEAHYEGIFEQLFPVLIEDHILLRCRPHITPADPFSSRRRPDYVLVEKHYRKLYFVELELAHHSLNGHVHPQIKTFTEGRYSETSIVETVTQSASENHINIERLRYLLEVQQPEVIVIVDDANVLNKGWDILRKELGAHLAFLEIFRSVDDEPAYSYSGYLPRPIGKNLTLARMHRSLNALVPKDPATLHLDQEVKLRYEGRTTHWRVIRAGKEVLLLPQQTVALNRKTIYQITECTDGVFELEMR